MLGSVRSAGKCWETSPAPSSLGTASAKLSTSHEYLRSRLEHIVLSPSLERGSGARSAVGDQVDGFPGEIDFHGHRGRLAFLVEEGQQNHAVAVSRIFRIGDHGIQHFDLDVLRL